MKDILKRASVDRAFRRALIRKLAKEGEHKPGDVWPVPTGFRAMNQDGKARTFLDRGAAKAFSKWKSSKSKKEKTPKPSEKIPKEPPKKDLPKWIDTGDEKADKIIEDLAKLQDQYDKFKAQSNKKERDRVEDESRDLIRKLNGLPEPVEHRARDYIKYWRLKFD